MLSARKILPKKQRVAETLKGSRASSWIEYSSYAVERPYISMNDPESNVVRFLAVDCDHENWDMLPGSMPKPRWTPITRDSQRHHVIWELASPVIIGENARRKPLALLAAVQMALTYHLNGDVNFTNTLMKNPWHQEWSTIFYPDARPVDLHEFDDWLLPRGFYTKAANSNIKPSPHGYSRNVDLFDHVRHWSYQNWTGDWAEVYGIAHDFNGMFSVPLPSKEVDATAKSVCRFMEEDYTGTPKPVLRQRTRDTKVAAILDAEASIRASGQRPTNAMIAAITGIPRRTVTNILNTL
ncbi:replication initiation protein [Azospirillum thiophilum]|uniref:replication initiation protein n=2 Tax=Azospirillum thiophilum TaxID=528244 RepID=UPI0009E2495A|nr:replication initiation protein [Azospirillum thiophilum]